MKKKVTAYETKEMHVTIRSEVDGEDPIVERHYFTAFDHVEIAGRTWLWIYSPHQESYIDMDKVVRFSIESPFDPLFQFKKKAEFETLDDPEVEYSVVYLDS